MVSVAQFTLFWILYSAGQYWRHGWHCAVYNIANLLYMSRRNKSTPTTDLFDRVAMTVCHRWLCFSIVFFYLLFMLSSRICDCCVFLIQSIYIIILLCMERAFWLVSSVNKQKDSRVICVGWWWPITYGTPLPTYMHVAPLCKYIRNSTFWVAHVVSIGFQYDLSGRRMRKNSNNKFVIEIYILYRVWSNRKHTPNDTSVQMSVWFSAKWGALMARLTLAPPRRLHCNCIINRLGTYTHPNAHTTSGIKRTLKNKK